METPRFENEEIKKKRESAEAAKIVYSSARGDKRLSEESFPRGTGNTLQDLLKLAPDV